MTLGRVHRSFRGALSPLTVYLQCAFAMVGKQIKAARALLGWTLQEFADKVGVHRNSLANIEAERFVGHPRTLAAYVAPSNRPAWNSSTARGRDEAARIIVTFPLPFEPNQLKLLCRSISSSYLSSTGFAPARTEWDTLARSRHVRMW
jgi:transcriptional regulator with XRE-family HTH domain